MLQWYERATTGRQMELDRLREEEGGELYADTPWCFSDQTELTNAQRRLNAAGIKLMSEKDGESEPHEYEGGYTCFHSLPAVTYLQEHWPKPSLLTQRRVYDDWMTGSNSL